MQGTGVHHFWGFTPALDCQEVYRTVNGCDSEEGDKPLCILLLDVGDIRHVLKTVAQRRRHSKQPLKFIVMSKCAEGIARDLLLLSIAMDWAVPLRQRAHALLEVWGNALLPERTSKYVAKQRLGLIKVIAADADAGFLRRLVDFSLLKYRNRDEVQAVVATWGHSVDFDMRLLREYRMRHQYADRFDFRANLMDWDYQFRVKPHVGIIHAKHFKQWRDTGVAFEFGDATYTNPNRSLASYAEGREKGQSRLRRGFWGDILVGPYHAVGTAAYTGAATVKGAALSHVGFVPAAQKAPQRTVYPDGISSSEAAGLAGGLFQILNRHSGSEQRRHTAVELAVFNTLSWLHEMETGQIYAMTAAHGVYSGLGTSPTAPGRPSAAAAAEGAATAEGSAGSVISEPAQAVRRARCIADSTKGVSVLPASSADVEVTLGKVAGNPGHVLAGAVDVLVLGSRSVHHLKGADGSKELPTPPALLSLLAPGAVVVAETARNVPALSKEQEGEFTRRVLGMGARAGLTFVGPGRALVGDTYAAGSIVAAEPAAASEAPPTTKADAARPGPGAAYAYVASEIEGHDAKRGDNPPAEHLVFQYDVEAAPEVRKHWARLQAAAPGQGGNAVPAAETTPAPQAGASESKATK